MAALFRRPASELVSQGFDFLLFIEFLLGHRLAGNKLAVINLDRKELVALPAAPRAFITVPHER